MHTTSTLVTSLDVTPATAKWLCVELGVPSNFKIRFALGVVIRVKVPAPVADAPPAVAAAPTRVAAVRTIRAGRTRIGGLHRRKGSGSGSAGDAGRSERNLAAKCAGRAVRNPHCRN